MDEQKADQLWRELTDTDRAAKRGHGIGFGTESTAADQHERSNAPAGLASTFRKATDIESKEMAQEKLSARDRIRARVKEAMQNKTASQHREDSQWENFLTQKKRERVGLDSIVDEHGRMLGCTYNYEDTDNTDLDNAIAKAAAVRASDRSAAEDDHAAAIFGAERNGSNAQQGHPRGEPSRGEPSKHHHRRSPEGSRARDDKDSDGHRRVNRDRHREDDRSDRHRERNQSGRHREREYDHGARRDRRQDTHRYRDDDDRRESRGRHSGVLREHHRHEDGEGRDARGGGRSHRPGSPGLQRHRDRDHGRRHRSVDREDRNARRGGGAVLRHEPSRDGRRDEGRRGAQRAEADGGRGAHGVRQQRAGLETDSRAPEREGAHDAADAWGPRSGMVVRSPTDGGERRALDAGGRDVHAVYSGALGAGAGEGGVSVSAGLGVAEGVVPEGAVVVAECELNREAPEVEAHDALDTSVVIKARGSWREQLKRRMEGVL